MHMKGLLQGDGNVTAVTGRSLQSQPVSLDRGLPSLDHCLVLENLYTKNVFYLFYAIEELKNSILEYMIMKLSSDFSVY